MNVGLSLPTAKHHTIAATSSRAAFLESVELALFSAAKIQARKEQQARPQQEHMTFEQDVHLKLREYHPRPVLGWRGWISDTSWS